jgi:hypothetical protein
MIVYRDQRSRADPRQVLTELRALARRHQDSSPPHDITRNALISLGELEAAVADAIFSRVDGIHPLAQSFRAASLAAGHVFWNSWQANPQGAELWWHRLNQQLTSIPDDSLPSQVEIAVPEGYAQYAVYPEMYLEAARKCHSQLGRIDAVCLGLRSIGTSLSAVVAAALEELGCMVRSATLRPRGHPFSRFASLTPELANHLGASRATYYLLIDEGPGISGSSLAGVAALLGEMGVTGDHILVFPSWNTDGSQLRSPVARETWPRHRQFTVSFEDVWLRSGRLEKRFPGRLQDISAGEWRRTAFARAADYPPVQPQHERRKYLLAPEDSRGCMKLLSFVGLGERTQGKFRRAQQLAAAGFAPEPETQADGFLLRRFVAGTPVGRNEPPAELLERVASYLAHLRLEHTAEATTSCSALQEMMAANLTEAFGESEAEQLLRGLQGDWTEQVVALDGRMLPHEWIRSASGYLKVDALDHHDDHFFPGCQDVAWDVSAAALELDLGEAGRRSLVERYRSLSGDRTIVQRLPFYAMAYLAFRLGYSALAASVLGETPDGCRFAGEVRRYTGLIERELRIGAPAR